jgi:hypothetical protein
VIKSKRMRWVGHEACIRGMRKATKIYMETSKEVTT